MSYQVEKGKPKSNIALSPFGYNPKTRHRAWRRPANLLMRAAILGMLVTTFVIIALSTMPPV